ncbi:unnamed protein product, partial [Amoebophrya sp. A25]|eukprot:GSA25T00014074001.1
MSNPSSTTARGPTIFTSRVDGGSSYTQQQPLHGPRSARTTTMRMMLCVVLAAFAGIDETRAVRLGKANSQNNWGLLNSLNISVGKQQQQQQEQQAYRYEAQPASMLAPQAPHAGEQSAQQRPQQPSLMNLNTGLLAQQQGQVQHQLPLLSTAGLIAHGADAQQEQHPQNEYLEMEDNYNLMRDSNTPPALQPHAEASSGPQEARRTADCELCCERRIGQVDTLEDFGGRKRYGKGKLASLRKCLVCPCNSKSANGPPFGDESSPTSAETPKDTTGELVLHCNNYC